MDVLTIVTGASQGLGRAVLATAPAGRRVDISRSGPPTEADAHIAADLGDPASWPEVVAEVQRHVGRGGWGRVVFVQAAGTIEPIGYAGEVDSGAYTANVLVNAAAPQVLGHGFLAAVREVAVPRDLVLISSGAARTAYPGWSSYCAAKAAADQWVRAVGKEQSDRGGTRVLSLAPGVVATGMQATIRATDERDFPRVQRFHELHDSGQLASPEDAAGRVWDVLDDPDVRGGSVIDLRER